MPDGPLARHARNCVILRHENTSRLSKPWWVLQGRKSVHSGHCPVQGAIRREATRASRLEVRKARSDTTNNVLQKRDIRSLSTIFLRSLHNMHTNRKFHITHYVPTRTNGLLITFAQIIILSQRREPINYVVGLDMEYCGKAR